MDQLSRFASLPADAPVWIFGSSRELGREEIPLIEGAVERFLGSWASHQVPLDGVAAVLEGRFLIIGVDPRQKSASGCSIDKLYQFVASLGRELGTDLLDAASVYWADDRGRVHRGTRQEFREQAAAGAVGEQTRVFDLGVSSASELPSWTRPAAESWHRQLLSRSA